MTTPVLFQTMARYNAWMNGKLYDAAATLSDEERKADRGAFFGSLHDTLDHIVLGDRAWMKRLSGLVHPIKPIGQRLFEDFAELRAARETLDRQILDWTMGLTEDWLAQPMTWTSQVYAAEFTHPRWGLAQHLFNHQTHHRGQATTLLKQMGRDVGPTDMPVGPIWP
jgi:uncharacterized damage-inducible protein DinB